MSNYIKADLYKITHKKSFLITMILIIFVSIIYILLVNKYLKHNYEKNNPVPIMSKSEYYSIYNGNYENYLKLYDNYVDLQNNENIINQKEFSNKGITLLENSYSIFFLIGIVIIFLCFNSLSYDYQHGTIKYLFLSIYNKKHLIISKIISLIIITLFLLLISIATMLITTSLLTHQNMFFLNKLIILNKSITNINITLYYIYKVLLYALPIIFMILLTLFLTILFKGNTISVIISIITYMFSLTITNLLLNHNINIVKYTFLPYLDFSYFEDVSNVVLINSLYNINFSYLNGIIIFSIYSLLLISLSFRLIKKDV